MTGGDGPEIWIERDPGSGSGPGPKREPGGRGRWIALIAGFAALLAIIGIQHYTGGGGDNDTAPSVSVTPPPTTPRTTGAPTTTRRPATTAARSSTSHASTGFGSGNSDPNSRLLATSTVPDTAHLANATWQLIGYGPAGVSRYTPGTGLRVNTPVPALGSGGPLSFAVTADTAVIRPFDLTQGFAVPDGKIAQPLGGLLSRGVVLPGPDPDHVWTVTGGGVETGTWGASSARVTAGASVAVTPDAGPMLVLVDAQGNLAGPVIDLPETGGMNPDYAVHPDGAGYVLFDGVGGTYSLHPDGTHLVTHGQVLATGPVTMVVYECDDAARCQTVAIDRATGKRRPLSANLAADTTGVGVTSPDGTRAALLNRSTGKLTLANLASEAPTRSFVVGPIDVPTVEDSNLLAFTPDGRYLLATGGTHLEVFDVAAGSPAGALPVPPLSAIAIRPAG